ncbi:MAG: hypothetical protein WDZ94_02075, partial [Patescibacteria group bacterium]
VSIKFATLVWLPILIGIIIQQRLLYGFIGSRLALVPFARLRSAGSRLSERIINWLQRLVVWIPFSASILAFIPLLTARSQLFHPWYLTWSLIWLPFMKMTLWTKVLLVFSFSSLLRYLPWMYYGGYSDQVFLYQQLMTWVLPGLFLLWGMSKSLQRMRQSRLLVWLQGERKE